MSAKLQLPLVHLNGTSREALVDGYSEAYRAVRDALKAVEAAGPNARDYYPLGDDAYRVAMRQHLARCKALAGIAEDMEALGQHCQGDEEVL